MDLKSFFRDPEFSVPVVRRRVADELLDLLLGYATASGSGERTRLWEQPFPSRNACDSAVRRLKKKGLIVCRRERSGMPVIELTDAGRAGLRLAHRAEQMWRAEWNGRWHVLMYDVSEKQRPYRDALRGFLRRMRMGCLQRSVYVSPRDVRPDYEELVRAAGIDAVAFLFECSAVLGRDPKDIVRAAWNFERLQRTQKWYGAVFSRNLTHVLTDELDPETLRTLAREEMSAYLSAMEEDPLLPAALYPAEYRGYEVVELHRTFVKAVGRRL
ncbi:MAG: hypothetical protein JXR37_26620 [Kiritimatiellae bacterium]|nr:hypothetical protein [Kiritimatiellia bacterium]